MHKVYITQFDKLDESLAFALQKDCNKWDPGIESKSYLIYESHCSMSNQTKDPVNILKNYEDIEIEKTHYLKSVETQRVLPKKKETEQLKKVIQEETERKIPKNDNGERSIEEDTIDRKRNQFIKGKEILKI